MKLINTALSLMLATAMAVPASAVVPQRALAQGDDFTTTEQTWLDGNDESYTWTSLGTGLYRDNFVGIWWQLPENFEYDVEIQECDQLPGRYRVVNPYKNFPKEYIGSPGLIDDEDHYIYIDATDPQHCYMFVARTGFEVGGNQELIVWSIAEDYLNNLYGDWVVADKENVCGKLLDGAITFPRMSLCGGLFEFRKGYDFDPSDFTWKRTDRYGNFRVKLPGAPDLDVVSTLKGIDDAHTTLYYDITIGASAEKCIAALVPGEYSQTAYDGMVDGTISTVEFTKSGTVEIPYTGDGIFTLVVIPYCDGQWRQPWNNEMEIAYDESEWRKVGKALYHESILSSNEFAESPMVEFNVPAYDYQVDVEESVSRPGYIRMVNAYGDCYPYSRGMYVDRTRNYYIYINATNPEEVTLEHARGIGLDVNLGVMNIWCRAERYQSDPAWMWDLEKVREAGLFGRFTNNEITFPTGTLYLHFDAAVTNWYWANTDGSFSLKFSEGQIRGEQAGVSAVSVDDSNAPVEYYNLQGLRVAEPEHGVYIRRQGSTVTKIVK